jgi:hypothetical protein
MMMGSVALGVVGRGRGAAAAVAAVAVAVAAVVGEVAVAPQTTGTAMTSAST